MYVVLCVKAKKKRGLPSLSSLTSLSLSLFLSLRPSLLLSSSSFQCSKVFLSERKAPDNVILLRSVKSEINDGEVTNIPPFHPNWPILFSTANNNDSNRYNSVELITLQIINSYVGYQI